MGYLDRIIVIKTERRETTGKDFAPGGVFVFHDYEYQGWMNELRDAHKWVPGCIAVSDESGRIWKAVGGNDEDGAESWQEVQLVFQRGGARPGAGRKPMKPSLKKQKKAFSLSPESVQALQDLQSILGLPSQSAVVEYLALKGIRESVRADRDVVEHQLDLF